MHCSRYRRWLGPSALGILLLAVATPVRAQNQTAAEALYRDGQSLLAKGQIHEACIKLGESQHADPALGTLINLASCHEKEGRTATAWSEFSDAAAQAQRAGQKDREQFAHDRLASLEKGLHRLVLEVMSPAPGMHVLLDGETFGQGAFGTAIPLDPGEHKIEVSAPSKKMWAQTIRLGPGAVTERVEVPALENEQPGDAQKQPSSLAPTTADTTSTTPPNSSTKRRAGFVAGGVGIAGVVVAVVFGIRTVLFKNKSNEEDATATAATSPVDRSTQLAAATSDHSSAATSQSIAIVGGVAGAIGVGLGAYLILSTQKPAAPKSTAFQVVPLALMGGAGASLRTTF